jgi:hypothetical protein
MIELIISIWIAGLCSIGAPIEDFSGYVVAHDYNLGRVDTVRLAVNESVTWVYEWPDVVFVTLPNSEHGFCAREKHGN